MRVPFYHALPAVASTLAPALRLALPLSLLFSCMLACSSLTEPPALACKNCGVADNWVACGPGVERLAEEAHTLFPEAKVELFTSDSLMNREEATAAVERMEAGEIDILIGTQMAAKGHHFPNLTLVAVVDADLGLNGGDLRAGERTFQLLYQVAGRAGRHAALPVKAAVGESLGPDPEGHFVGRCEIPAQSVARSP